MKLLLILSVMAVGWCTGKYVEGPRRAKVTFDEGGIRGEVTLEQASINSPVKIRGEIYGLKAGQHNVHIHRDYEPTQCRKIESDFEAFERHSSFFDLGEIKTPAQGSKTYISLISSGVSLYDDEYRGVYGKTLYVSPSACGLIEEIKEDRFGFDYERPTKSFYPEGKKMYDNVESRFFGGAFDKFSYSKTPSNLNVDGVERPDLSPDSLSLKSAVSTAKVWKTGRIYEYDYKGFIATGMFGLSPKVSGGSMEGRLIVEPVDESTVNIALLGVKSKMFNEDVVPELWEADPGTDSRVVDGEFIEKPFQIKIINGKIETVAISKDEPLWTVNLKRALASKLQLQLDGTSGVFGEPSMAGYYADNAVYHTMEGCTTGECETWYHITRMSEEQLNAEHELLTLPELCDTEHVYEIVKNRDFDKCRVLPIYNYVSVQGLECDVVDGAGCENKFSHVDLTRIVGCRSREGHFLVQRIRSVDKFVHKPFSYETEASEGKTVEYLLLRNVRPSGSTTLGKRMSGDVDVYQTLSYSFDDDYKMHGPLMQKPTLHSANSPAVVEVDEAVAEREAVRLLATVVSDLESESFYVDPSSKLVPAKINMLRRAMSWLDYPQLSSFVGKAMKDDYWSTVNQVTLDALVLSGTNPSLMVIRDLITKGHLAGEQAVQAVSMLTGTVETPTKELVTSFIELLKSEAVTSHRQLKITTALFITRIVYQACVNATTSVNMFPKLVMGEFCTADDHSIVNELVPWLTEQLEGAADDGERVAMLTALGNLGHEMILPAVLPYITSCEPGSADEFEWIERHRRSSGSETSDKELRTKWFQFKKARKDSKKSGLKKEKEGRPQDQDQDEEEFDWQLEGSEEDEAACRVLRSKAIFALSNLAVEKREVVSAILMPVFFNKDEDTEVRLAAASLLFVSNPPEAFWTRVAASTWFEPNEQVAHFVYTTIASMVANKDPTSRRTAFRAESVLPLMKPMPWTSHSAINYVKAGYQEKSRLGYVFQSMSFPGFESFVPSHYYSSMDVTMGPWFAKLFELSIYGKRVEKFLDRLLGKPGQRYSGQPTRDSKEIISGPELSAIHEELKIEARATGQPELFIYLNFLDNYQRFFTLNPSTIMETLEKRVFKWGSGAAFTKSHAAFNYHKYLPILDSYFRVPSAMGLAYTIVGHHSLFFSLKGAMSGGVDTSSYVAKLEGTFKPVVVTRMTSRLMAETPFTRSYPFTGVDLQTVAAMPGRFSLSADLKTTKLTTSWEWLDQKLHLFKYSVKPFTSIRKMDDFTPAPLLKETKIVSLYEKPEEATYLFGRPLGLSFMHTERGDIGALRAPYAYSKDWFGNLAFFAMPASLRYRESDLYLDAGSSESKAFNTYFAFATKTADGLKSGYEAAESLQSAFGTFFGDMFKSYLAGRPTTESEEEWSTHKFQRVFKSMANPFGYSVDWTWELTAKSAESKPRRFGASVAYGSGDFGQSRRASFILQHGHESEAEAEAEDQGVYVFCADYESTFPETVIFKRDSFSDESERTSTFHVGFGKSCTDDRKITITSKMSREGEAIPSTIGSKLDEESCTKEELMGYGYGTSPHCLTSRRLASILNKATITIEYNEMPAIFRNATFKAYNAFRHWMAPYISDNQVEVRNADHEIRIEAVYHPIVGSMDLRVYKPRANTFYHSIDVHPVAEVLLPTRLAAARSVFASPGICWVGHRSVTTFDGLLYNSSIGSCDQVITKDCSGRYKFAVLARHDNFKKVVTVFLDKEKIELDADAMKIKVNGMDLSLEDVYSVKDSFNTIVAQIRRTSDNFIRLDSPTHMISVACDAKELLVSSSAFHRGRLCGLCGSSTGNKLTDLTGPRKCALPRHLMNVAYELHRPAGCKSFKTPEDFEGLRRVQDECVAQKKSSVFGFSDATPLLPYFQQSAYSKSVTAGFSTCTQYRNKKVVREDKICFSTIALPKCTESCKAADYYDKKVPFHCMDKNYASDKLSEDVAFRPLDEISAKEVSFVQTFKVATACVSNF